MAGVGNVFLGDDAFGVEVVRLLAEQPMPAGVEIRDFGIRGVHLVYELLNGCDLFVLSTRRPRGEAPGTVSVIESTRTTRRPSRAGHHRRAQPVARRHLRAALRARRAPRPQPGGGVRASRRGPGMGLSEPVEQALPHAVRAVLQILAEAGNAQAQQSTT